MATEAQAAVRDPSGTAKGIAAAAGSEDGVLFNACLCCYNAVDLSDVVLCFKGRGQYLCLTYQGCVDVNTECLPIGMIDDDSNGSVCKLGLGCLTIGLTTDLSTPCYAFRQCLCFRQADQLLPDPSFGDAVTAPVCGCCFLQCMPNPGCAQKAPAGNFTVGTPKVAAAGAPPVGAEMAR